VPDKPPAPGQPYDIAYKLHWSSAGGGPPDRGIVVQSRRGRGYVRKPDGDIQYVVDFDGASLRALGADARPEAVVEIGGNGVLHERNLYRNQVNGRWRMTVRFKRNDPAKPVELRAFIRQGAGTALTETWSYIVPPEPEQP